MISTRLIFFCFIFVVAVLAFPEESKRIHRDFYDASVDQEPSPAAFRARRQVLAYGGYPYYGGYAGYGAAVPVYGYQGGLYNGYWG